MHCSGVVYDDAMKGWLIVALCLAAPTAYADDEPLYSCKAAPDMEVRVVFRPDPSVHEVVVWMMGTSCKNVIIESGISSATVKLANGTSLAKRGGRRRQCDRCKWHRRRWRA